MQSWARRCDLVMLAAAVALVVVVRVRLLALPLERDEGEYAYGAQLLLDGGLPYRDLYSMKWPGIYAAYALVFCCFGQSTRAIHAGLLVVNLATALGVYGLARTLLSRPFAAFAAAAFMVLSLSPSVHGVIANAEHFAIVWAVYGAWCLRTATRNESWPLVALAGALSAMAPVMKQQAMFFVIFGGLAALLLPWPRERTQLRRNALVVLWYASGAAVVWIAMLLAIYVAGIWPEFYELTVVYARQYVSQVPLAAAPALFAAVFSKIWSANWPVFVMAALGLMTAMVRPSAERPWLLGLAAASAAAVCPGFWFREHYFLFLAPAVGLFAAIAAQDFWQRATRTAHPRTPKFTALASFALVFAWPLASQYRLLFELSAQRVSGTMYGPNLFVESPRIAEYVREHVAPNERFMIFGSEPQICFYAHRRLATGFVYMYPLTEDQPLADKMQRQLIAEVEATRPEYAIVVNTPTSWLIHPNAKTALFEWLPEFLRAYESCGYVRLVSPTETEFQFDGTDAVEPPPDSAAVIMRRKAGRNGENEPDRGQAGLRSIEFSKNCQRRPAPPAPSATG